MAASCRQKIDVRRQDATDTQEGSLLPRLTQVLPMANPAASISPISGHSSYLMGSPEIS